jgi:hydroxypyruvate reductase
LAAIDAADARRLTRRALADPSLNALLQGAADLDVLAVGKAALTMLMAFTDAAPVLPGRQVGIGHVAARQAPTAATWYVAGHPIPDERSTQAGSLALKLATSSNETRLLVVLLSGGASSLMALPAEGVGLEDKQVAVQKLLGVGADIHELNTVRKHLSSIKGGQLAAAARGSVLTLAVSDVVGDDLSVIGSGPTVADPTTYAMALDVLDRRGGRESYPPRLVERLERGAHGRIAETPKPGDARLARSVARVIGGPGDAVEGARAAAAAFGYHVRVLDCQVTGEARVAAHAYLTHLQELAAGLPRPLCVVSSGETTVHVKGGGRGGRNQEFALAMVRGLSAVGRAGPAISIASFGTDGIDGPTDAAGAIVDGFTMTRSGACGLGSPEEYLDNNDTYSFFHALGDLIHTGTTGTNVGDLQVALVE